MLREKCAVHNFNTNNIWETFGEREFNVEEITSI
jgi:hypothetical protein